MHDTRRTRAVLGLLLVGAVALLTLSYLRHVGGGVFGGAERLASKVAAPLARLARGSSADSAARVSALESQLIKLRVELSQEQLDRRQYGELSQLLQLSGRGGYRIVAATVIGYGLGYQQSVTLDAGSKDGVTAQETVINGQGLVGRVTAVSAQTCTVLLAIDATATGVRLAPGGEWGWVTGPGKTGSGLLRLQVVSANAGLRPGEQLVTAASIKDRPFVPGVPVGVISRVENGGPLTGLALVRPYVDFTALDVVGVVVAPPTRNPGFSVLPPSPSAHPAPTVTLTPRSSPSP